MAPTDTRTDWAWLENGYLWGVMDALKSSRFPPEWLPMVACTARFMSGLTTATVVWFQDEYALPIMEPALSQLLDLDWFSIATELDAD